MAASLLSKRVDHAVVDDLERVAEARRRMDDALGGGTLLPSVREDLRLVVAMLNNAAYSEEVGKRLHAVAAEFGRLAGWLFYDADQLLDPALSRDRAAWLCDLATARVGAGAVEEACMSASEAASAIRRLDSAHNQNLLADFRRAAAPHASSTAVRDFDAKYRDLLGAALA